MFGSSFGLLPKPGMCQGANETQVLVSDAREFLLRVKLQTYKGKLTTFSLL